jgi:hypothetical protein
MSNQMSNPTSDPTRNTTRNTTGMAATTALPLEAPLATANVVTIEQALLRLDLSRARLLESLRPQPSPPADAGSRSFHPLRRARAWLRATPWGGVLDPVLTAVSEELVTWWDRQSWRHSALMAKNTMAAELLPVVRRYPIAAVLLTAAAGAIVAGSGVWRWRTVRRSAAQLGAQLRRVGISQLSNPALQSVVLGALVSYFTPQREPRAAKANAAADAPANEPASAT